VAILTILCIAFWAVALITGLDSFAIVAIGFGGVEAVKSAVTSIRSRQLDVNTLMVLAGIGAILIYRFLDAATLFMLFSLSNTLENFAFKKTEKGIEKLVKMRPTRAIKIVGGVAKEVPVEELKVGDHVRVHAYSQVTADGEIIEGQTTLDESAMTGEALPVSRAVGDSVMAGTQNLEGGILIRVTSAGTDSSIDKVIRLVKEAQETKTTGQRISVWFGQSYTIFVVLASLVSYGARVSMGSGHDSAFYASLVLLVALSPCALVISTPSAILSAMACAARRGVLVRGGGALEASGRIKAATLDKTGTLTYGRFEVVRLVLVRGGDSAVNHWSKGQDMAVEMLYALGVAAALEERTNHPLAVAISALAKEVGAPKVVAENETVIGGVGISAEIKGVPAMIGRPSSFEEKGNKPPLSLAKEIEAMQSQGLSVALLHFGDAFCAIALQDKIRENASRTVKELYEVGLHRIVVLTGDHYAAAKLASDAVGISEVHADLLPGEKTKWIRKIQAEVGPVMMVGDGVNDAPALAASDFGVAMGGLGSDVAIGSADAVIVQDRLDRLPWLVRLGRSANRTIKANIVISLSSIAILTLISLTGHLALDFAVLGHEGTTVLVILNGLRLLAGPRQ
jgi:Cd2+/Zn2+-exporting ATPase